MSNLITPKRAEELAVSFASERLQAVFLDSFGNRRATWEKWKALFVKHAIGLEEYRAPVALQLANIELRAGK